jgi:hypothetical protein
VRTGSTFPKEPLPAVWLGGADEKEEMEGCPWGLRESVDQPGPGWGQGLV